MKAIKKITVIVLLTLLTFGCKTVKKEWVKENFTSKQESSLLKQSVSNLNKTLKSEISDTSIKDFNEKLNQLSKKITETESKNTTVSGSITAEDGKEKSVSIGNTEIKSIGANITFETTSSTSLSKEFETKYHELSQLLQSEREYREVLRIEIDSLKNEFANFVSNQESEKTTKYKEVKKRVISILVLLIIGTLYYFRKKIPFLN